MILPLISYMVFERNILEDNSCITNVTNRSGIEQDRYFSTEVSILVWRVGQINELKSRETMSAVKRC